MTMAVMIAMFYLGLASGVMGAVLLGTTRSRDAVAEPLRLTVSRTDDLRRAA